MKGNKGITLIALVITIIVLIILAAVTLATLTGDNGILNRAQRARDDTAVANAIEEINVALNSLKVDFTAGKVTPETTDDVDLTAVTPASLGLSASAYDVTAAAAADAGTVTIAPKAGSDLASKVTSGTFVVSTEYPYGNITGAAKASN